MSFEIDNETLKKLQRKSLDMAVYFVDFCKKHNLTCYFCGGCCIGAVRHKGFIPWDDDIDFFMPRPDYEKLLRIFNSEKDTDKYSLQVSSKELITKNQFATICDNDTTYIKTYMADIDINHGLSLDIIPLDARPPKNKLYNIRRKMQIIWALTYSLAIIGQAPTNHGAIVNLIGKVFLFFIRSKKIRYSLWRLAERKMSKYNFYSADFISELTTGPVFMRRDYPYTWFESAKYLDFEEYKMPVPCGYHDYLTMAFGDYMQIPDEKDRVTAHDFEFIDMDNSYKKYYGIYYCKGDNQ